MSERVYDAFPAADGLDCWFTSGAFVDAQPGDQIRFRWKEWGPNRITDEDGGPVLEAERPKRTRLRFVAYIQVLSRAAKPLGLAI